MISEKSNEMYPQHLVGNIQFHIIDIYSRYNFIYQTHLAVSANIFQLMENDKNQQPKEIPESATIKQREKGAMTGQI